MHVEHIVQIDDEDIPLIKWWLEHRFGIEEEYAYPEHMVQHLLDELLKEGLDNARLSRPIWKPYE